MAIILIIPIFKHCDKLNEKIAAFQLPPDEEDLITVLYFAAGGIREGLSSRFLQ
jgi:hypothetical protein